MEFPNERKLCMAVMKEAAFEGMPILGDIIASPVTGQINVQFMHFDHLDDLSISEQRQIRQLVMITARNLGYQVLDSEGVLRFRLEPS